MVDYSAAPLKVLALDYTTVSVSWSVPTGSYSTLRLVRSQAGYPEHQEDGVILVEDYSSNVIRSSFTDGATKIVDTPVSSIPLVGGKFAHYSIWIRLDSDGSWIEAGRNYCLIPIEHSTKLTSVSDTALVSMHDKIMSYLPRMYTSVSKSPIDEIDPTSDLYRFLKAFSFTLDEILTYADLIAPNPDIGSISPSILNTKISHLSIENNTLGATKSQKKLITNALTMYQDRGGKSSLDSFVTSLTGYPVTITDSPNMMLSTQSSSFNYGEDLTGLSDLGGWIAGSGTTISYSSGITPQITASSTTAGTVTSITITSATGVPQTNQSISGTNIPTNTYVTKVVYISSGSYTIGLSNTTTGTLSGTYTFGAFTDVPTNELNSLQLPGRLYVTGSSTNTISICSSTDLFTKGIPVTPGETYAVSYYIKEPANTGAGAQSKAKVAWYDSSGAQISTTQGWSSYYTSTGVWSKATGTTFTAPVFRSYNPTRLGVASGVATLLFTEAHGFSNGEEVYISDILAPFAGLQTITGVTTHTITFNVSSPDVANTYDVYMTVESKQKAAYAIVSIETAATKTFYIDLIQFSKSATTDYYEARGVNVYLNPTKTNYIENPSFRVKTGTTVSLSSASGNGTSITYTSGSSHGLTTGQIVSITGFSVSGYNVTKASITVTSTTQFTVVSTATGTATGTGTLSFNDWTTSGGTFSRPTATRSEQLVNGTVVGQIAISSSATPILTAVTDTGMSVGQYYTFSIYLRATSGTPSNVRLLVTATDGTTSKSASFNNISLTSTWTRHSVTVYVPDTLVSASTYITSRITTAAAITSTTIQFDGAQLEDGFVATDYFDGSYSWAGASWAKAVNANSSYSYLYANKDSKMALLKSQITDWIPFKTPYIVQSKYGVEFSGVA